MGWSIGTLKLPSAGCFSKRKWRYWLQKGLVGLMVVLVLHISTIDIQATEFPLRSSMTEDAASDLLQQGEMQFQAGQFRAAIALWQQAADQFELMGHPLHRIRALSALATAFEQTGEWSQANGAIAQAIALLQTLQSQQNAEITSLLAQALTIQGNLQLSQGQETVSLSTWEQAEEAYQAIGDWVGRVGSQINQARAMQSLGLYRRAALLLAQVEQTLQSQADSSLKAIALWELGNVLQLSGDLEQASEVLQRSQILTEQLQASGEISAQEAAANLSGIWLSMGNLARDRGDGERARLLYQQAITMAPTAILQVQAQAVQLNLFVVQQQWHEAQSLWLQLQDSLATLPPVSTTVYTQISTAQSLMQWEQTTAQSPAPESIAPLLTTAIQQARASGDRRAESYALGTLGHLYEQTRQLDDAQALTQQALKLAQSINASEIAYQWYWQSGRLFVAQGGNDDVERGQAIAAYSEAVTLLQSLRDDLVAINPGVQFSFREQVEPVYREFVELLLRLPTGKPNQDALQQAREVIEGLQLAELDNFFREACVNASPVQIDQRDPRAAVIYPIILPHQLSVILSLPGQPLHYYAAALTAAEFESLIDQMRQSLRPNSFREDRLPIAQRLYDLLLRPAEADLVTSNITTLVFVPDGSLRGIPMTALHDGQKYVVEHYNITLVPGLQLLQARPLERQRLRGLAAGLSQPRQGFPPLPNVAFEIEQIEAVLSAHILLDEAFTNQTLQNQVSSNPVSIVHLATHGQFSSNAEDTFILTWDSQINVKQLGALLQAREGNLQPIDLLVLSACQTAAGDRRAALGMAGVAVRSGARSTLATLWSVSDRSTAIFMTQFYQQLRQPNVSKAEALRRAQLALLQEPEYQSPYFWAPFILLGDWL